MKEVLSVREIDVSLVAEAVRDLCIEANFVLPESLCNAIKDSTEQETDKLGKEILCDLCENLKAAKELQRLLQWC